MSAELTQTSPAGVNQIGSSEQAQPLRMPNDLRDWLVEQGQSRNAVQCWASAGERFRTIQSGALQTLKELSFPTRKTESWRYTSVQPLIAAVNSSAGAAGTEADSGAIVGQAEPAQICSGTHR